MALFSFFEILLFISSILVLFYLLTNFKCLCQARRKKRLPGPYSFPFIGSVFQVLYHAKNSQSFHLLNKLCKKYGPVMEFRAGVQNYVMIEDYSVIKKVLISDDCCGRNPNTPLYLSMTMDQKIGILFNSGEEWRRGRRFAMRSLIGFGFGQTSSMEEIQKYEVHEFMTQLSESAIKLGGYFTFDKVFAIPMLNLIWKIICGQRFDARNEDDRSLMRHIDKVLSKYTIGNQPVQAFPFLRFLPIENYFSSTLVLFDKIYLVVRKIINEIRESESYLESQTDFMSQFLLKIDDVRNGNSSKEDVSFFTDDQLVQICTDLLLAGSDTSSNYLEFLMLYMITNPQVQEKVYAEIESVIGTTELPTLNDKIKMPYTEATILEALRLANIAPVIVRTTIRDTEIEGCHVEKDTFILLNTTKSNKDPNIWEEPERFKPERFLDSNNMLRRDTPLIAFGGGKRICIGYTMAKNSIFIFFVSIIQKYRLKPSPIQPNLSIDSFVSGITNCPKKFYASLELR